MKPMHHLSAEDSAALHSALGEVKGDPYRDRATFSRSVAALIAGGQLPTAFGEACAAIRAERESGQSLAHVIRNCPVDSDLPTLDHDDPVSDKRARKKTFIGEALLELFAQLVKTPLLAYARRFNGDFYTDVVAINRYSGKQTGFSDGELVYHNDRTAHSVRADFITLLGMVCPDEDLVYTGFVDGRTILAHLSAAEQTALRQPWFVTPFDVLSKDNNKGLIVSETHSILENEYSLRYLDTHTTVAPQCPPEAKDALLAFKNALARAEKTRHRILTGDLFSFANQDGLHNREKIDVRSPERARGRWLLKTYAFRDRAGAACHSSRWVTGVEGLVDD
ncbi:TauD/TfdA family dioxygenase [Micromonospora sp. NPDC051227]|uniref:TauD/TfdA family dioxygenase n=1 Tax=Micromonospora sp. NPDC051227 TaxID=3364285 RepID=UPI0037AB19CB